MPGSKRNWDYGSSVRGLVKAGSELLWACLTYNIMQWVRLIWRQRATA